jgi:nitrite reductase/ring-hydroxylating ferredoxin subunit
VDNFVTIGQASDIGEGEMRQVEVAGIKVAIANVAGTFYAFGDTCTHLGCSLSKGDLEETTVTCPCHGSMFDVTSGEVLRGPAKKPEPSYRVEVRDGALRIGV